MILNKEIINRLNDVIVEKNLSDYSIAEGTGIHATTIMRYKTGKSKRADDLKIEAIAKFLNINRDWLITGEGDKATNEEKNIDNYIDPGKYDAMLDAML